MIATAVRAVELGSRSFIGRRSRILFQQGQQQGQQQFQGQGQGQQQLQFQQVRYLNVHEYLSMSLLKENGINVPTGYIASTPEEAEDIFLNKLNQKGMVPYRAFVLCCFSACAQGVAMTRGRDGVNQTKVVSTFYHTIYTLRGGLRSFLHTNCLYNANQSINQSMAHPSIATVV